MLAIRVLQEQGVVVEALNFRTVFECCKSNAAAAAADLGVRLSVAQVQDDYLDVLRRPRFGYGRGANPCVDCRIYMCAKAKDFMHQIGASMVVTGEIVGQRPMSQKRRDLDAVARHSGLEDRLIRPLSAKLLPPTLPERTGQIDRSRLYDFQGRGRKELIALGRSLGLKQIPDPSTGCILTEKPVGVRVFDLLHSDPDNTRWDFELLKTGRHIRFDPETKMVVGRSEQDNATLEYLFRLPQARASGMLVPENFIGPTVLIVGPSNEEAIAFAGGLMLRYSKLGRDQDTSPKQSQNQNPGQNLIQNLSQGPLVRLYQNGESTVQPVVPNEAALTAKTLGAEA